MITSASPAWSFSSLHYVQTDEQLAFSSFTLKTHCNECFDNVMTKWDQCPVHGFQYVQQHYAASDMDIIQQYLRT